MQFLSRRVLKGALLAENPLVLTPRPVEQVPDGGNGDGTSAEADPREAAEAVLAHAREEAERIRRQAYEEGLARGLEDAAAQIEAERARVRERAADLVRQAEAARRETLEALEGEIVELAQAIARKVVMQELSTNPELVRQVAREALALLRDRRQVLVFCHPEDARLLREKQDELTALLPAGATLRFIEDPEVERGGILADSGEGLVDARLDTRWRAALAALRGEGVGA